MTENKEKKEKVNIFEMAGKTGKYVKKGRRFLLSLCCVLVFNKCVGAIRKK